MGIVSKITNHCLLWHVKISQTTQCLYVMQITFLFTFEGKHEPLHGVESYTMYENR